MPAFASTNFYDNGLNYLINNVTHFIACDAEPSDYTDANTLSGNGGQRLGKRPLTGGELTQQDDGSGGREVVIPRKGYLAEESGSVSHLALVDDSSSELIVYTEHDDGNGNPVSLTVDEGYNIEQTTVGINSITTA